MFYRNDRRFTSCLLVAFYRYFIQLSLLPVYYILFFSVKDWHRECFCTHVHCRFKPSREHAQCTLKGRNLSLHVHVFSDRPCMHGWPGWPIKEENIKEENIKCGYCGS